MAEPLTLYLAAPRGFCAGVDRAIKLVEMAVEKWGAPVYVRHEIVHNRYVADGLKAEGAVFVEGFTTGAAASLTRVAVRPPPREGRETERREQERQGGRKRDRREWHGDHVVRSA